MNFLIYLAKFKPNILNSAVYLVGLIMQISTFAINYQASAIIILIVGTPFPRANNEKQGDVSKFGYSGLCCFCSGS